MSNLCRFFYMSSTVCCRAYRFLFMLSYFVRMTIKLWWAETYSILSTSSGYFLNFLRSRLVAKERSPYLNGKDGTWSIYSVRWERVIWRPQFRHRLEMLIYCEARTDRDGSNGWSESRENYLGEGWHREIKLIYYFYQSYEQTKYSKRTINEKKGKIVIKPDLSSMDWNPTLLSYYLLPISLCDY